MKTLELSHLTDGRSLEVPPERDAELAEQTSAETLEHEFGKSQTRTSKKLVCFRPAKMHVLHIKTSIQRIQRRQIRSNFIGGSTDGAWRVGKHPKRTTCRQFTISQAN